MWFLSVGMVKQPADHSSEFQMSNEDFPALPGAPAAEPGSSNSILESVKLPTTGLTPEQVFIHISDKYFGCGVGAFLFINGCEVDTSEM